MKNLGLKCFLIEPAEKLIQLLVKPKTVYNEIKTNQLINNIGNNGNHKGLCIPKYSNHHGTNFNTSFNKYVNSDWINYLNQLIDYLSVMENLGSGIQKQYQNKTTI